LTFLSLVRKHHPDVIDSGAAIDDFDFSPLKKYLDVTRKLKEQRPYEEKHKDYGVKL